MDVYVIKSGSQGNCVLINGKIAIDMGVSFSQIRPFMDNIQLVLLTHTHSDHFRRATLTQLHFQHPSIKFVCAPFMAEELASAVSQRNIILLEPGELLGINDAFIECFSLIHDVPNVGYIVEHRGETALYATDTQRIPIDAPGLDMYLVENNYYEEEIRSRLQRKLDGGQFSHETRAFACHMSNETVCAWLHANADPAKSRVIFLHRHHQEGSDQHGLDRTPSGITGA